MHLNHRGPDGLNRRDRRGSRLLCMVETVHPGDESAVLAAARLLHDFNAEYDEPTPSPHVLAPRLVGLVAEGHITLLLARAQDDREAVGVAALRVQPAIFGPGQEAYLAELYVVPGRRGEGYGRALLAEALRVAREQGADYAFLVTSEEDLRAQRVYEAAGFRRTEGEGGPLMLAYERDL